MLTVTLEMLEHMPSGERACKSARRWFAKTFPAGGELAEVWVACPEKVWRVWFAVHCATTEEVAAFAQACAERATAYAAAARAAADSATDDAANYYARSYVARVSATRAVNAQSAAAYYDATAAVSDHALRAAVAAYKSAAYTADAAYYATGSAADEIQTLVDWARRVLFGEAPLHSVMSGENNGK